MERKKAFLEEMLRAVNAVPIEKVVGKYVELEPRGRHLLGLCPFHSDHTLGSFVVTPEKNIWKCFFDGLGGNGIRFYMQYHEVPYLEAAFMIARDFNLISKEEYEQYSKKKWDQSIVREVQRKVEERVEPKKAEPRVIAAVYSALPYVCPLSDFHKKVLIHERGLREEDLKDYFTCPTRRVDLPKKVYRNIAERMVEKLLGKKMSQLNIEEQIEIERRMRPVRDQITMVPGFYMNEEKDKIDFVSYTGIGFLIRDDAGKPVGVQIRRDKIKKGEERYVWFSSTFASTKAGLSGGASSGAPAGVLWPKNRKDHPVVCLTEGRFKAEKIAAKGNIAVYLPGVTSWKAAVPLVSRILKPGTVDSQLFLMMDADLFGNPSVFQNLRKMDEYFRKNGYMTYLVLWPKAEGKGFDDLCISKGDRYKDYLTYIRCSDAVYQKYQKVYDSLLKKYGAKHLRDLKDYETSSFTSELQRAEEEAFLRRKEQKK